jgi:hypothetical protein
MTAQDICYWCGGASTSRDHVPPLNLFPKNTRKDLETVPACVEHNQKFTKLEERMRFYLQAGSENEVALSEFDAKTIRSLEDPKAEGLVKRLFKGIRRISLPGGESAEVTFEPSDYRLYFEKIARGLHYLQRSQPYSGSDCLIGFRQSFVATPAMVEFFNRFAPHFNSSPLVKIGRSPYPEIFRYRFIDTTSNGGGHCFAVVMQFYKSSEAIAILHPKDLEEKLVTL